MSASTIHVYFRRGCYFVDLFVRRENVLAAKMYASLGYIIYRQLINYYNYGGHDVDAYGRATVVRVQIYFRHAKINT